MARIRIELPTVFHFSTELPVRITDVNYGGHVGNDALLALLHEARVQFLKQFGFSEQDIAGVGLIMVDAAICYRKEVFYGETLRVEVAVTDISRVGCDFVYRATKLPAGEIAADAKTGVVFFDYRERKMVKTPERFLTAVQSVQQAQA